MSDPILEGLNPAQKEAVTWPETPLLIIAGAGSGKTRILTRRIAYLIQRGVPAFQVLGVTFTNKAAEEMRLRVEKLVQQSVWISTFHSTCLRILRMDGPAIDLDRNFTIYDEHDQLTLIKECLRELNMNEKQIHPKGVRERIQRAKDYLISPFQYAEKAGDLYEESVAKIYQRYEEKMKALKACDFGDLILKTVTLFDRCPPILESWQTRFQRILIDEYQDTNHAQYRFVNLLASRYRKITVVGDPDQSIYSWRGADIRNILNFETDYPESGVIKMEQNYRSTEVILDAANELIRHNRERKAKSLWTEREGGEKIALFEAMNEKDEAETTVAKVQREVRDGATLADQVIFYRVHAQSRILEDCLRRANIPYKIIGGTRFYDRREIKDVIAYLRVLAYPHDEVSLKRIINVPPRGVGKKTLEDIGTYAMAQGIGWGQALEQLGSIAGLASKAKTSLESFRKHLEKLRNWVLTLTPRALMEKVLELSGYLEFLAGEKTIEAQSRIENIEEFLTVIDDFEEDAGKKGEKPTLAGFLESISLMTDLDAWKEGTNVLTLMTLHTAKGLEFPLVYIVGLEEGIFPNVKTFGELPGELEEERRLCYVGITRAKKKLTLSYARERHIYGSRQYNLPSRFLSEIPSTLYQIANGRKGGNLRSSIRDTSYDDEIEIEFD
ncbi:MAG: ATP-dependent helicase [Candidatus Omnitrophota bacterium]